MGIDPSNWTAVAERDLRVARVLLREGIYESAVFHAHQAAESALKAVWIFAGEAAPPRTHRLVELAEAVEAPGTVQAACRRLNPHYAGSRYPDAANGNPADNYDLQLAEALVDLSEEVVQWCLSQSK
jgi:HEPN domain-containing protein